MKIRLETVWGGNHFVLVILFVQKKNKIAAEFSTVINHNLIWQHISSTAREEDPSLTWLWYHIVLFLFSLVLFNVICFFFHFGRWGNVPNVSSHWCNLEMRRKRKDFHSENIIYIVCMRHKLICLCSEWKSQWIRIKWYGIIYGYGITDSWIIEMMTLENIALNETQMTFPVRWNCILSFGCFLTRSTFFFKMNYIALWHTSIGCRYRSK